MNIHNRPSANCDHNEPAGGFPDPDCSLPGVQRPPAIYDTYLDIKYLTTYENDINSTENAYIQVSAFHSKAVESSITTHVF